VAEHTPQRAASRLETWRKRYALVSDILTPQRLGLLGAVALLGVLGAFGGWQAVEGVDAPEVPLAKVGEPVDVAPFEITVRRARHFDELRPALYPTDGYRYLVVSLDVTSHNKTPVAGLDFKPAITVDAEGLQTVGDRPEAPRLLRGVDALDARSFQPGLTTSTIVVWQQADSTPVPAEVTVTLSAQTWRQSVMDGGWRWSDPAPVARVTLPVEALEAP